jgi:hypothetical protein
VAKNAHENGFDSEALTRSFVHHLGATGSSANNRRSNEADATGTSEEGQYQMKSIVV